MNKQIYEINGEEIAVYRLDNDINGNPRYVVHFLELGIKTSDYGWDKLRKAGIKKYHNKKFGGGYVFQSYNVQSDLKTIIDMVKSIYKAYEEVE